MIFHCVVLFVFCVCGIRPVFYNAPLDILRKVTVQTYLAATEVAGLVRGTAETGRAQRRMGFCLLCVRPVSAVPMNDSMGPE